MITLDTSAIYASLNLKDSYHEITVSILASEPGPFVVPVSILSEIAYLVEARHGQSALDQILQDVEGEIYTLDCGDSDIARIRQLILRYQDMGIGFADSAVIACAERRGGRILSHDRRHFLVVSREGTIELVGLS